MNCRFIWNNLPQQIKDKLGVNVIWRNIPKALDDLLNELKAEKPNCYNDLYPTGHKQFLWFNLPAKMTNLCELNACVESIG